MAITYGSHDNHNLSLKQLEKFERENDVKLTNSYRKFLLKWNGGRVKPNVFMIFDEQGPSVLNVFYGIGDMYDNLTDFIDIMYERLPAGFIPIADDSSGNTICLGTKGPYYDKIYFWDHEQEPVDPDDMSNMYFLANDIDGFLNGLYEDNAELTKRLSKEDLIELVDKICNPKLSDEEVSEYIKVLEHNVPHPAPSDLIFWNEEDLSPEQVVELALAYEKTNIVEP